MNTTDPVEVVDSAAAADISIVEAAPSLSVQTRELRPHPQLLSVWIWGTLMFVGPAVLVALTVGMVADHWLIGPLAAVAAASIMAFVTLYGRAWLARFRCRLLADGLWVDRGVWWRSETFVPRARVQHTDVQQGPIARRYGIASLKVFTAGAGHGEIEIDGLIHADALWLRDELLGRHGQDGV
jgi:uncharacterized protein